MPDVSGWPRSSGHQGVAGFIGSIGLMGFIGFMGSIMVLAGMVNRFVRCDRERASDSNGEKNNDLPGRWFSQTMVIEKPQDLRVRPRDFAGS